MKHFFSLHQTCATVSGGGEKISNPREVCQQDRSHFFLKSFLHRQIKCRHAHKFGKPEVAKKTLSESLLRKLSPD